MADPGLPAMAAAAAPCSRPEPDVDLTGDEGPSSPKRQRREEDGTGSGAAGVGTSVAQAGPSSSSQAGPSTDPLDGVPDAPFHMMRVRGIPTWANEGFLGVKVADLVRGDMRWVLISNYMVDFRWLLSACPDLRRAQRLVVVHGEKGYMEQKIVAEVAEAGLQSRTIVYAPPLPIQFGAHHSKAFLVQYDRGLRVVIHTANTIYPDCNNKSQGIWWQDFPPKEPGAAQAPSEFERDLVAYLSSLRLPPASGWRQIVAAHDFSSARAVLIGSVPGYHTGDNMHLWGHMRMRACLNRHAFPAAFAGAPLVAQFSSLGSVDEKWLREELAVSLGAGRCNGGQRLGPPAAASGSGVQLVWPTVSEVQNSLEGWLAGNSIPGPSKNVDKLFLRQYWHRWGGEVAGRQRAMPHQKSYCRYIRAPAQGAEGEEGQEELAWFLLTSSNLSKAAWGQLQKKNTQLMVRSYELGVLLLPNLELAYRASRHCGFSCTSTTPMPPPGEAPSAVRFVAWKRGMPQEASREGDKLTVPLPLAYRLPPTKYEASDTPWAVGVEWPGMDSLGCTILNPHGRLYGLLEQMEWGDI